MRISQIAKVCHNANKAYCETLGDLTQLDWENAPEWQRESAINGVTFRMNFPAATNEDIHRNWMQEKLNAGWKYGERKDPQAKLHPCLVDYKDLSDEHKAKDALFSAIVTALAPYWKESAYPVE